MKDNASPQRKPDTGIIYSFYFSALVLFGGYIYLYQFEPFDVAVNDFLLYIITPVAALIVAVIASAIFLHYHPEDFPRKVWQNLMVGCWLWFLAEAAWAVVFIIRGEVSTPGISDIPWVGGFVFFSIAFFHQYSLIFPTQNTKIIGITVASWVIALLAPYLFLSLSGALTSSNYINYFYPLADIAVGVAGIALVYVFRGGALMRPWIGLVVFGVSDLFYAWAEQTGLYSWSSENNSLLTLAIDASYLAAYLILAFGFLGHWLLTRYGLRGTQK